MPYLYTSADQIAKIVHIADPSALDDEHYTLLTKVTREVVANELIAHYPWLTPYSAALWAAGLIAGLQE